ncbi:MAG: DUF6314 family protein [Paracoccaceae bacterium]
MKLSDFEGTWRLARDIRDHRGGAAGRFEGRAVFTACAPGLAYHEEGLLRIGGGPPLTAVRDYLWREAAGRIFVDHAGGKPFHDFDPAQAEARHHCAPDLYKVRYDFADWPVWRAEWVVTGPRKDYVMVSEYVRSAR